MISNKELLRQVIESEKDKYPIAKVNLKEEINWHLDNCLPHHSDADTDKASELALVLCQPKVRLRYFALREACVRFYLEHHAQPSSKPAQLKVETPVHVGKPYGIEVEPAIGLAAITFLHLLNKHETDVLNTGGRSNFDHVFDIVHPRSYFEYRQSINALDKARYHHIEELSQKMAVLRDLGYTAVLTHGIHDLYGNIGQDAHLQWGKLIGGRWSVQTVVLDSDSLTKVAKGKKRPYVNAEHRTMHLCNHMFADLVFALKENMLLGEYADEIRKAGLSDELFDHVYTSVYSQLRPNIIWIGADKSEEYVNNVAKRAIPYGIMVVRVEPEWDWHSHTTAIAQEVVEKERGRRKGQPSTENRSKACLPARSADRGEQTGYLTFQV
jgi:hypothetical protein